MDDNLGYIFAAFAVTWILIAAYLYYLGQQTRALRDEAQAISETAPAQASDDQRG